MITKIDSVQRSTSSQTGLVFALELSGNSGRAIKPERWGLSDNTQWFHFDLKTQRSEDWIKQHSGLSPLAVDALTVEDTRPRVVTIDNGLLIYLRGVNCNPESDPEDMVAIRLWVSANRIISLRHRRVMAIQDIKELYLNSCGPISTSDFLVHLCENLTNRISSVVNDVKDKIDEMEEKLLDKENLALRGELSSYRRMIIGLKRYLTPQRDTLAKLQTEPAVFFREDHRLQIRELHERTIRCLEELEACRERATVIQEELQTRLSEQMNRTIYLFSIIATIFLPLSLITGLLGVNVGGIPGGGSSLGFPIVSGILIIIAIAEYVYFKKKQVL